MTLSRIELDGYDTPEALAERIHELAPHLSLDFSMEDLARQLDISEIKLTDTAAYEAAIIMDELKSTGAILLARSNNARRRRFSIGHELGHFLLPDHHACGDHGFTCSTTDMAFRNVAASNQRKRIEAEANRFAAQLLMPSARIRANLRSTDPDLQEVLRLAEAFNVSKAAMARSYIDAHAATLALVVIGDGLIDQVYRPAGFPWIEPSIGEPAPWGSITSTGNLQEGTLSLMQICEPETWLAKAAARPIRTLREQVLVQRDGFMTVLLFAE
ncbi:MULTISPECIES: ImmA/IrrE family metallo-endopeptidase [Sphingomonas]|uniref:ImmA/IrrE family metallo-endopeptidase n=1 Tax=Sphingomonas TaxID=13687 RepID=UPI000DEF6EEC|nr:MULTISPECIES: ImmA/IrrE family metallo-endopeptidase [Sphingomonas]